MSLYRFWAGSAGVILLLALGLIIGRFTHPRTPATSASAVNQFSIKYLDAAYEREPEKSDLYLPTEEDQAQLQLALDLIFPQGTYGIADEEKCVAMLRYIASKLKLKDNDGAASKILKDGYARCGGMSYAFIMLCRKTGMPARYVGSIYLPAVRSHAIAEVFYQGGWHLFDATFGLFFYSNDSYDRHGHVLSFHELLTHPYEWAPFKVVDEPWSGDYDDNVKNFGVQPAEGNYLKQKYGISVVELYRDGLRESFPVAYGSNDLVSYPVDADIAEASEQWFGKVDQDTRELTHYDTRFSGSGYLGGVTPGGFHTWLIKAPKNNRVVIEYYSPVAAPPRLQLIPLRAVRMLESKYEQGKITFTLLVNDSEAIASVYCPEGTYLIDAMHIRRE